ncbi:serine/threonine-protein phosphatase 6 regulatory ankyrin repeat subunit B-like isoform X9 [Octopus sinensis]|uniref:Serine/threonine-protein phosphatase 6 regulatory ankyrin repeat subunit B-like isoform X9 n=1 Tax=Octopus sinensis TaxID=2607531 RepID=A0A7E6FR35_9MOLL|nr:serine/threonine-protein phosphatase 6 regulatory ankyrin repeat subunit B-like isoform X9 [Octopus sinensis]
MDVKKIISNIVDGDFKDVERLIKENPGTVNQINSHSQTFLMAACEQGSTSLIAFLIESGANMDMSDKEGLTALHYAVKSRKIDAVASLVSRGANVNKQDSWGYTPLHRAVRKNYEDVVKVLLSSKGNNILQVTQRNNDGGTPLHLASLHGHTDTAKLLLQQNGTDVRVVDKYGCTPLHLASLHGHTDTAKLLLQQNGTDVRLVDKYGRTPLHLASLYGHTDTAKLLLQQNGTDVMLVDKYGRTPLHLASLYGHTDTAKLLLQQNGTDVRVVDNDGCTPLHHASFHGHTDTAKLLLQQNGTDVRVVTKYGRTPLHLACWDGHTDTAKLLLQQNGTDVRVVTKYGRTPLHLACWDGHTDTAKLLLQQNGIDANKLDKHGDTPLHLAVQKQHYGVVSLMLAQDSVKLDIGNHNKMTPLLEAVSRTHLGIIHKFIIHGANMNAVDNDGNNCLHLSIIKKEIFHSEVEPIPILDECCKELQLDMDRRLSGIVVLSYLASQGASLYHRNDKKVTPLDCIENQHLKEKLKTFLQSLCRWCQEKKATVTLHPCQHTVICQNCCSQLAFKQCPICRQHILRKSGFVCPKSEEEATQAVAESVVYPRCREKTVKTVVESFESLNLEENRSHSTSKKVEVKQQKVETPKLEEKCLQDVAKLLGVNWQQVGRNLGIRNVDLGIIRYDYPYNTKEQSFQMLHTWYTSCDPEMRTLKTLRKALKEAECFEALQCLPSEEK